MVRRERRGIGVVFLRRQPDVKPHAIVIAGGQFPEAETRASVASAQVGESRRRRNPCAVRTPKGRIGNEEVQPCDGHDLTHPGAIGDGIERQGCVREAGRHLHVQFMRERRHRNPKREAHCH